MVEIGIFIFLLVLGYGTCKFDGFVQKEKQYKHIGAEDAYLIAKSLGKVR